MRNKNYLEEFHKYHQLNSLNSQFNPMKSLIVYNFGINPEYLTTNNLKDKNRFVITIQKHSKYPSELEKDLDLEFEEVSHIE